MSAAFIKTTPTHFKDCHDTIGGKNTMEAFYVRRWDKYKLVAAWC